MGDPDGAVETAESCLPEAISQNNFAGSAVGSGEGSVLAQRERREKSKKLEVTGSAKTLRAGPWPLRILPGEAWRAQC